MAGNAPFVTLREAAERLGVHESTVRRYADRGLIGAARLPSGVRRLRSADVDRLAARLPPAPDAADAGAASGAAPARPLETLAAEQGVPPLARVEDLAAPGLWESDEEADRFIAMTHAERDRDR